MVVRSVREGARVTRGDLVYLGRVVDRARGVYRSRERGCSPTTWRRAGSPRCRRAEKAQCPRRGHDARRVSRRRVPTGLPPVVLGRDDGLRLVGRRGETDGILVDPAGPSDSCHLPVTVISNHNGQAGEEVRLTCVVQRDTGLPLLFRHVAGNAIDVSTITRTIAALGAMCFGPRFPPQSRSIKSITHFTMPSVSRSTKGYSLIQITRSTSGMAYSSLRQTLPLGRDQAGSWDCHILPHRRMHRFR